MLISLDLETTGIEGQIIEFAAVIEDRTKPVEELKFYHTFVLQDRYDFEIIAAQMNRRVIDAIADFHKGIGNPESFTPIDHLQTRFDRWMREHGHVLNDEVTFTGKNFATFDLRFLLPAKVFDGRVKMHRRVLDPGSMYWIPELDGDKPPNTETCLKRAGLDSGINHDALEDARNVLRLIRKKI